MMRKAKRCEARRFFAKTPAIAALALATLLLPAQPLHAQEVVDPRSGHLLLTVADLVLPAGAIKLELSRTLGAEPGDRGLLGARWRMNWESRLVQAKPRLLVAEAQRIILFSPAGDKSSYVSAAGERLVFEKNGRGVRTRSDGRRETFDTQGRLVERDERNGNKITLRYGADGRLSRVEGPKGSFLQFAADSQGRVVGVETSAGATVRYAYVNDQLAEVHVNGGPPTRYAYDAGGALVRIEDPQSGAVELSYDAQRRVLTRRWADGSQERFEHDDAANRQRHIDRVGAVSTTQWSEDRRRVEITDPLGHRSVITYDSSGRPLSVTDPTGATSRLAYDALGRTVVIENSAGQVTRFEYLGESLRLKTIIRPDGTREGYEYDGQGNLTAVKLGSETTTALSYYPDGSLATTKGLGSPEQRFAYRPDGRLKSIMNPLDAATSYEYDRRGNLIQETNPLGGAIRYQYDAQDRLVSVTDPVGGMTRYEHDPQGRLGRKIGPDGAETRYAYDARGRLAAETDPAGQVARYAYDAAGRLVSSTGPDGAVERLAYDPGGRLVEQSDWLGRSTRYEYDALGRVVKERRASGLEVRYRYDVLGNLAGLADLTGMRGEFQRDVYGRLTATVDPLGAITRYIYDPLGNLISLTDPRGQVKQFVYGADGALTRAQESSGDTAQYEYDAAARLVAIHRPSGGVARMTYDAMGNVVAEEDPLGNQRRHTYDAAGRRTSTTDAMGRVSRYTYDAAGRLTRKQLPDGTQVTYQYDRLGNLVSADDGAFPVRSSFDSEGRILRVEYPAIKKTVAYEYDALGLRSKLIYSNGFEVRYEYDGQKRLAAIVLADGKRFSLAYDVQDRLQAVGYPNGITGRWEYDAADRITKLSYQHPNGTAVAGWSYRYDPAGNPLEWQDNQQQTARLQYDPAGRLTEETASGGTNRYRYLAGGNRDTAEVGVTVVQYRHDAADRLLQAGQEQLTYDANGNLIGRKGLSGITAYEYDAEERLTKVVGPDGATTTFGYAPTGERIWKRDRAGLTYYLYDSFDLIQEVDENGAPKATYIHGPGIDRPLALQREGQTYCYHVDQLGSIRLLTDGRGQVAAAYDYDPFGGLRASPSAVENPFRFTGREWDPSTGLYYYRARYYDAGLGRFLSPDPVDGALEDVAALNRYAYVRNAPTRYRDPLGLMDDQGVLNWAAETIRRGNAAGVRNLSPMQQEAFDVASEIISANDIRAIKSGVSVSAGGEPLPSIKWSNLSNMIRGLPTIPEPGAAAGADPIPQQRVRGPSGIAADPDAPTVSVRIAPRGGPPGGSGPKSRSGAGMGPIATPVTIYCIGKSCINIYQASPEERPHVIASEAGGWVGGVGGPALVGYCVGAPLGPLGSIAVGAGSSYVCSQLGGWLVPPPGQAPPSPPFDPLVIAPPPRSEPPAGPLVGPVTGALPGAPPRPPPRGTGAYDPTKEPGMPRGTPGQIARAGQEPGPGAGGTSSGQPPDKGQTGTAQGGYAAPSGQGTGKEPEGSSVPPYWGYPPAGVDQAQPPERVTVDSLTPGSKGGSKGSRGRSSTSPPPGPLAGGTPSGGSSPTAPAPTPGVTAQNPPAQTAPSGADPCAKVPPPLCKDNCERNCRAMGGPEQWCVNGCAKAGDCKQRGEPIAQTDAQVRSMCYSNMLKRCQGGCVSPGKGTCEQKAFSVCHCDLAPGCSGRAERTGDGPWHVWAQQGAPLAGMLLPALLAPECLTPN